MFLEGGKFLEVFVTLISAADC